MPDKKTLLYDAFLGLVRQGGNPADITVGAIAARAGIGKGTVYDYFPAKEALFSYSLSRYAHELVDGLRASCTEGDFRTRFYVMLDFAAEQFDKNQMLFQLCFLSDAPLLPCGPYRQELCENLERAKAGFLAALAALCEQGRSEGVLGGPLTPADLCFAFFSVTGALGMYLFAKQDDPFFPTLESLEDFCYDKFVKLLR